MKRLTPLITLLALLAVSAVTASAATKPRPWAPPTQSAAIATAVDEDPDMPTAISPNIDKAQYMELRAQAALLRYSEATVD